MCSGNPMRNAQNYASQYGYQPQTGTSSYYPSSGMESGGGLPSGQYGGINPSANSPQTSSTYQQPLGYQPKEQMEYAPGYAPWEQGGQPPSNPYGGWNPGGQTPPPQAMSQFASSPMAGGIMSQLAQNQDGTTNTNDYGSMWQMAGGADLTGQREQAEQQATAARINAQSNPQGQQSPTQPVTGSVGTETPPGQGSPFYNFGTSSPTYLNGATALNRSFSGPNGPTAPPTDPRMVWGLGNNGGMSGWNLVNGYNGYKG